MRPRTLILPSAVLVGLLVATASPAEVPTKRPTDEERGRELFDRHCVQCHGEKLHGQGPATQALVHKVPDLVGKVKVDDKQINVVFRGRGAMPAYEATFDKQDARRVLQHMKRLSDEEAQRTKAPAAPSQGPEATPGPAPDAPTDL